MFLDAEYLVPGYETVYWCHDCGNKIVPCDPKERRGVWKHELEQHVKCEAQFPLECPAPFAEFLVAHSNGTWTTTVQELPRIFFDSDHITLESYINWAEQVLGPHPDFSTAVYFGVYKTVNEFMDR